MADHSTLGDMLHARGLSRRAFMQFAGAMCSVMALPAGMAAEMANNLAKARRQSVIWLSFQECTGCTESFTRTFSPSLEDLIFDFISLDYHHTLQSVSGEAAEEARRAAMKENAGKYIVVVDGSIPMGLAGAYSVIAGQTNIAMLAETIEQAAAVVAVGTCAAYGGLPEAHPNPTGAVSVMHLVKNKPVINIPGCPPMPQAMVGTLTHILAFGKLPELDEQHRPKAFFGDSIHDRCYRRPFYEKGLFAKRFDDEGARAGWCLFELGCKGPITYNACASLKWNGGVSFPIQSGHGCLGCSEDKFWDRGSFYQPLSASTLRPGSTRSALAGAAIAGVALGAGAAFVARQRQASAKAAIAQEATTAIPDKNGGTA